jgi:hypothetical protein
MTDQRDEMERAERIRRLQARRAASTQAPKRGHPAAATRWTLAGLSVASFFTIAGAVAVADQTPVGSTQPATAVPLVTAPAVSPSPISPAPVAIPRSAVSTHSAAPAPHTTTRGS